MMKRAVCISIVGFLAFGVFTSIGSAEQMFEYNLGNISPIANISVSPAGVVNTGANIIFSGNTSYDPDGTIVNYTWDFGDGGTAYTIWAVHKYITWGIKTVKLTVKDNQSATDDAFTGITVNAVPNVMVILLPSSRTYLNFTGDFYLVEQEIKFDASATSDPDSIDLNFSWNFGDSSTSTSKITYHNYTVGGNYTVNLTVCDGYVNITWSKTLTIQDLFLIDWNIDCYTDINGFRYTNFSTRVGNNGAERKEIASVRLHVETFTDLSPVGGGETNNTFTIYDKCIMVKKMEIHDVPISLSKTTYVRISLLWNNILMDYLVVTILNDGKIVPDISPAPAIMLSVFLLASLVGVVRKRI